MPRRTQLAFALILVMVLAPLGGVSCGIACLAAAPHHSMQTPAFRHDCMRASTCCHSSGPAICTATQQPEVIAALLATDTAATHAATALVPVAEPSLPNPRAISTYRSDSSPPGQLPVASPIPLRI